MQLITGHGLRLAADSPGIPRIAPASGSVPVVGPSRDRGDERRRRRRRRKSRKSKPQGEQDGDGPKGKKVDIRA